MEVVTNPLCLIFAEKARLRAELFNFLVGDIITKLKIISNDSKFISENKETLNLKQTKLFLGRLSELFVY